MKTRLTDILEVEHPVMLAGMGGVSYSALCAAVSDAGGFGTLGASTMGDAMVDEIRAVRKLTDKPFGVDLLTCTSCGGQRRVVACVFSSAVTAEILTRETDPSIVGVEPTGEPEYFEIGRLPKQLRALDQQRVKLARDFDTRLVGILGLPIDPVDCSDDCEFVTCPSSNVPTMTKTNVDFKVGPPASEPVHRVDADSRARAGD
jgi:NAD(P)H-dependent flavin oxidoreductase YrpB (nitropropane dioxygenase family)